MRQKIFTLIGWFVLLNIFLGCVGLQKEPIDKNYFNLNVDLPLSQDSIGNGDALLVKEFSINPAFDSHSFILQVSKNEYKNDFYNEFVSYPANLITEKITESLCETSHFTPALTSMRQEIKYRLSGKITKLYGDFQKSDNPKAVIEIRMTLEKNIENVFNIVSNKTYFVQEPISSSTPDQLVSGWNKGLTKIIAQFINDFKRSAS
ncbi:MAG: hypothetical protein GY699_11260 [Desulfobacteraceae bacterium]|nr:hypothetical protein [Desulfobacteraceae bacterium]